MTQNAVLYVNVWHTFNEFRPYVNKTLGHRRIMIYQGIQLPYIGITDTV